MAAVVGRELALASEGFRACLQGVWEAVEESLALT